jgi:Glycosyltransferase sugar-binding region containing DXD motif
MSALPVIHSLWVGSELSALELLTLQSFTRQGHDFYLWVYDLELRVPESVQKKNAREILPETAVFFYKNTSKYGHGKGSIAGFSDIFRYKLLYEYGGYWVDMDITCLHPFDMPGDYFLRHHHTLGVVGNILKCPPKSELMQWCYEQATQQVNADNKRWSLPIEILNEGIRKYELQSYIQRVSNNDQWPVVARLLRQNKKIPVSWKAIHWMNEEFRHLGINKNMAVRDSVYERLLLQNHVPFSLYTGEESRELWWQLSKLRYTLINLRARWNWIRNRFGTAVDQV